MDPNQLRAYLSQQVASGQMTYEQYIGVVAAINNADNDPARASTFVQWMISEGFTPDQMSTLGSFYQQIGVQPTVIIPPNSGDNPMDKLLTDMLIKGVYSQSEIEDIRTGLTDRDEQWSMVSLTGLINAAVNSGVIPALASGFVYNSIVSWLNDGHAIWSQTTPSGGGGGGSPTVTPSFSYLVDKRSITISVSNTQSYSYYHYRVKHTTYPYTTVVDSNITNTSYTYNQLTPGASYSVSVAYSNSSSGSGETWLAEQTFTAPYPAPTISTFSAVQNGDGKKEIAYSFSAQDVYHSASYTVSVGVAGYGMVQVDSGVLRQSSSGYGAANGSGTIQIEQYGSYVLRLTITNEGDASDSKNTDVVLEPKKLTHFSWTDANYPEDSNGATDVETKLAYNAVISKGMLSDFSYKVWNDLCHRVKDTADYAGYEWDEGYLNYQNTLMSDTDKEMTANRFNSLNYNIRLRYATGIPYQNKGDKIMGNYFTTMVNALNSWIDIAKQNE